MKSIYQNTSSVYTWYGQSVTVPSIDNPRFVPFASSCMGIAVSLLNKTLIRNIRVGLSGDVDTAYANPDADLIVISDKFMTGHFNAIGHSTRLNSHQAVGAILGVIVHEIGHFAYSPKDLQGYCDFIQSKTNKQFQFNLARSVANILEDIYIESAIAAAAPTLQWTLDAINCLMLTDSRYQSMKWSHRDFQIGSDAQSACNLMLFAKVTDTPTRGTSPDAKKLFKLARSVVSKPQLRDRFVLAAKIYELIAADKQAQIVSKPSQKPLQTDQDDVTDQDDDQDDTAANQADDTADQDDDQDDDSGIGTAAQNSQQTDDQDDDQTDDQDGNASGDDDQADADQDDDQAASGDNAADDQDDIADDDQDVTGDQDNDNATSGSGDDDQDDDQDGLQDDDQADSASGTANQDGTDDQDNDNAADDFGSGSGSGDDNDYVPDPSRQIPQIDTLSNRTAVIPDYSDLPQDGNFRVGLDGNQIQEIAIPLAASGVEIDRRYTRLAEMARQRTNATIGYGMQQSRGRNLRQVYRIATDQKVFSTRIAQETIRPMEIILLVDCSISMNSAAMGNFNRKIENATQAVLGAAVGLINGKAIVTVYGHTADPDMQANQVVLYPLMQSGESTATLSRRLATLADPYNASTRYLWYSRDGYAIFEMSRKFHTKDRRKVLIVISDGEPNCGSGNYKREKGIDHTRQMVNQVRKMGIDVFSISIDTAAFAPNNTIYGTDFNTCSVDANSIDTLIRQLYK